MTVRAPTQQEPPASDLEVTDLSQPEAERSAPTPVGVASDGAPSSADTLPVGDRAAQAPATAPWVDDVPEPVTPYEQRVSETIKVGDLPPVEQLRGRLLANRYLAEEVLEKTAASVSYRAYHLALDRAVTVRILPRGLACSDEACQEVRRVTGSVAELDSPHLTAALDFGVLNDGWPFLVTEHATGKSLALLSAEEGKFVLRRVLHVGKHLAAGLRDAHAKGLVHGLLSPHYVFVVEPGTPAEVATILGFGVNAARGRDPGAPRKGVFGVPFYVSPEQAANQAIDARSDIYSLGVVLYELMTGSPPFSDGDFAAVLCQHLDDEAPRASSRLRSPGALARGLDALIARCLQKDPARRYQSASEVLAELTELEAEATRNKRRPMPEVQRPTATIHSPAPKTEGPVTPGAKVIVHEEGDEHAAPPVDRTTPRPSQSGLRPVPKAAERVSIVSPKGASSARAPTSVARPATARRPRVSVDQATIKISAMDRELVLQQRRKAGGLVPWRGAFRDAMRAWLLHGAAFWHWLRQQSARMLGAAQRRVASMRRRDDSRS